MKRTLTPEAASPHKRARTEAPIPLIQVDERNQYVLTSEGIAFLNQIAAPFTFMGVVGPYRTGKSFLMNQLWELYDRLYGSSKAVTRSFPKRYSSTGGFQVDSTINACTKGIWIHPKPIQITQSSIYKEPFDCYFLDSEGLGDVGGKDSTHDVKIFSLLLLLTELFLFNSSGPINEAALQQLSVVTEVTKKIQFDAGKNLTESSQDVKDKQLFPDLLWICRNFGLKLQSPPPESRDWTADEYLENALSTQCLDEKDSDKIHMRQNLQLIFPSRYALTMPTPCSDEKQLQRLTSDISTLRPEFKKQVEICLHKMIHVSRPKRMNGRLISGKLLTSLLTTYIDCINNNSVPIMKDIWNANAELQCRDVLDDVMHQLDHWGKSEAKIGAVLIDLEKLDQQVQHIIQKWSRTLRERLMGMESIQHMCIQKWDTFCQQKQTEWLNLQAKPYGKVLDACPFELS